MRALGAGMAGTGTPCGASGGGGASGGLPGGRVAPQEHVTRGHRLSGRGFINDPSLCLQKRRERAGRRWVWPACRRDRRVLGVAQRVLARASVPGKPAADEGQRRQTESAAKRKTLYTPRDRACRKHHQTCVKEETGGWSRRLGVRAELPGMAAGFEEVQDFCSFSQLHNVQAAPWRKNRRSRVIRMARYRSRRPQTAKYRHDSHRERPARRREVHESGIRDPEKPGAST